MRGSPSQHLPGGTFVQVGFAVETGKVADGGNGVTVFRFHRPLAEMANAEPIIRAATRIRANDLSMGRDLWVCRVKAEIALASPVSGEVLVRQERLKWAGTYISEPSRSYRYLGGTNEHDELAQRLRNARAPTEQALIWTHSVLKMLLCETAMASPCNQRLFS